MQKKDYATANPSSFKGLAELSPTCQKLVRSQKILNQIASTPKTGIPELDSDFDIEKAQKQLNSFWQEYCQ